MGNCMTGRQRRHRFGLPVEASLDLDSAEPVFMAGRSRDRLDDDFAERVGYLDCFAHKTY